MAYKHLSQNERYQIFWLMKAELTVSQIALPQERSLCSRNARKVEQSVLQSAFDLLRDDWSPEQIAGILPISHETLYRHVYADKNKGGTLAKLLRSQKKKRKRYGSGRQRRGQIPNRRSIHDRPVEIELRLEVGHWEGDTVTGSRHQQAIVTLVERKSGFAKIAKVTQKTADLVSAAMVQSLCPFGGLVKTITLDNGKEFTDHQQVDRALGNQ